MRLHETLARFAAIVRRYEVIQYEVEGLHVSTEGQGLSG